MKKLPYEIAMIADKLLEHATMAGEGMKFTHADGSSTTEKQFAKNMLASFGVTIEDLKEHLGMTNQTPAPQDPNDVQKMVPPEVQQQNEYAEQVMKGISPDAEPEEIMAKMIQNAGNLKDMEQQDIPDVPVPEEVVSDDPTQDLSKFSMKDLGLEDMDPEGIHTVKSGRVYMRIAMKENSGLYMSATLEDTKQPAAGVKNGAWRAVAVVVRFIVKGKDDHFTQLQTRPSNEAMDSGVIYKDKITFQFALGGNPIYTALKFKELKVAELVNAELVKRLQGVEVDSKAVNGVLDALYSHLTTEDPVAVTVL